MQKIHKIFIMKLEKDFEMICLRKVKNSNLSKKEKISILKKNLKGLSGFLLSEIIKNSRKKIKDLSSVQPVTYSVFQNEAVY